MKRISKKIYCIIILVLLLLPSLGLLSFKWQKDESLEEQIKENLFLKKELIHLYGKINHTLFKESGNSQVVVGKEEWLFFGETLPDYLGKTNYSKDELEYMGQKLLEIQNHVLANGGGFLFICAPNKNTIYSKYMPWYYLKKSQESNWRQLAEVLNKKGINYIDVEQVFSQEVEYNTYYQSDSHWNHQGALLIYKDIMGKTGIETYDKYENIPWEEKNFLGDLTPLYLPKATISEKGIFPTITPNYHSKKPIRSFNDLLIETQNNRNHYKMLVFRDSFGEQIFPFLANNIGKMVYKRSYEYDQILNENLQFDMVIIEIVERELGQLLK